MVHMYPRSSHFVCFDYSYTSSVLSRLAFTLYTLMPVGFISADIPYTRLGKPGLGSFDVWGNPVTQYPRPGLNGGLIAA